MKRLLRSVLDISNAIAPEDLTANFQRLAISRIEWARPDDRKLYEFIYAYYQRNSSAPSQQTVADYFERAADAEVQERLKDVAAAPYYTHSNFSTSFNL